MKTYTQENLSELVKNKLIEFSPYVKDENVMFISYKEIQNLKKTNPTVAEYIEKNIGQIDETKYSEEYLKNSMFAIQKAGDKIDIYPVPNETFKKNYKIKNGDIDLKNKLILFNLLIEGHTAKLKKLSSKEKRELLEEIRNLRKNYKKLKNENPKNLLEKLNNLVKPLVENIQVAVKKGTMLMIEAEKILDFSEKKEIKIQAPWGETQKVKPTDFIAYNKKTGEIYKIEGIKTPYGLQPNGYKIIHTTKTRLKTPKYETELPKLN